MARRPGRAHRSRAAAAGGRPRGPRRPRPADRWLPRWLPCGSPRPQGPRAGPRPALSVAASPSADRRRAPSSGRPPWPSQPARPPSSRFALRAWPPARRSSPVASRFAAPGATAAGFRVRLRRRSSPGSLVLRGTGKAGPTGCFCTTCSEWRRTPLVDWLVSGNSAFCRLTSLSVALLLNRSA
jgi:hypothetical protein